MSAVTVQEIVKKLRAAAREIAPHKRSSFLCEELANRIEQHGIAYEPKDEEVIAPPDGMVLVPIDPTDAMQTAHDMYGDTSDWRNAVISAAMRAAAEIGRMK